MKDMRRYGAPLPLLGVKTRSALLRSEDALRAYAGAQMETKTGRLRRKIRRERKATWLFDNLDRMRAGDWRANAPHSEEHCAAGGPGMGPRGGKERDGPHIHPYFTTVPCSRGTKPPMWH
jgi:hypothetical protein